MNGNDKNMEPFPASVLEKYLNGELSAPEMHAVERAALEDPFLADALEGMALHRQLPGQKSFREDLGELQERLKKNVSSRPAFRIGWRAAAAVILLLGLGITVYYTQFNKTSEPVAALSQKKESISHAPAAAADSIQASIPAATPPRDTIHTATVSSNASAPARQQRLKVSIGPQALVSTEAAPPIPDSILAAETELRTADRANYLRAKTFSLYDSNSASIPKQLVFTGKVINENNKALAGASLFMKGNNAITTVTDKYGNFSVKLPRSDSTNRLTVAYTGYEEASLALDPANRTSNIIRLQPQLSTLNEVVVSGFGAKRKEVLRRNIDTPPKQPSLVALPADGWPAYNSYLESGKKTTGLDSALAGVETISFIVNKKGILSSFKVDRSISPAHDSAAIRLIRQGPSWKLMKGRSERAVVTIIFP